jgi:hypothetical protein
VFENMKAAAQIDDLLSRFRLCSRELFNQFFHGRDAFDEDAWIQQSRYAEVEALLFEKLVIEPAKLSVVSYGALHPQIGVELRSSVAPIMINREIETDSGYWDYHVREMTSDAQLGFRSFFDSDQLDYRDHRYAMVRILAWPSRQDAVSRYALIETQYVRFVRRDR